VNYVTADGKTNWAEGSILIAFYAMIVRFPPPFLVKAPFIDLLFRPLRVRTQLQT
jgi:hypothetical protein